MSKIENYYHHDGEQSGFDGKENTELKERCSCNLYIVTRQRIPLCLTKPALKRTPNAIFDMKEDDLDES